MQFSHERDIPRLRELATKGIYLGTSSWIYEGWLGTLYQDAYLDKRGNRFSKTAFNEDCLAEHSRIFPTVCFDGAYYNYPTTKQLEKFNARIVADSNMAFKATQFATLRDIRDYKTKSTYRNESYLHPTEFVDHFLKPVADTMQGKLGPIIFEFSPFFFGRAHGQMDYSPLQFVKDLHGFFERLPKQDFQYAVEVRDPELITFPRYFDCLEYHGVAHVLNQQTWMPTIAEQLDIPGVLPASHSVIRALVRPGVKHNDAVDEFEPYAQTQLELPEMRQGIVEAIQRCLAEGKRLYAYINNRTEGNAPNTIASVLEILFGGMSGTSE